MDKKGGGIYIDEKRIDKLKKEESGFGMVFKNYEMFKNMRVRENVGLGMKMSGKKK